MFQVWFPTDVPEIAGGMDETDDRDRVIGNVVDQSVPSNEAPERSIDSTLVLCVRVR